MKRASSRLIIVIGLFTISLGGCSKGYEKGPMSSSLTRMTHESSSYESGLVRSNEVMSISGLMTMPVPGSFQYFAPGADPSTAIGESLGGPSYVVVGETTEFRDCSTAVGDIKQKIEEIQNLVERGAKLTLEIVELRAQNLKGQLTPTEQRLLDAKVLARDNIDEELENAKREYRRMTSQAGIWVARWWTDDKTNVNIGALPVVDVAASEAVVSEGFVIFSGVRVGFLVLSDDLFKKTGAMTQANMIQKEIVSRSTVTTYVLQAKNIASTHRRKTSRVLDAAARLNRAVLTSSVTAVSTIDTLSLDIYLSTASDLTTGGVIGKFKWRVRRIDYDVTEQDGVSIKPGGDSIKMIRSAFAAMDEIAPTENGFDVPDGWKTVVAQTSMPGPTSRTLISVFLD